MNTWRDNRDQEHSLYVLKAIENNSASTQRELSQKMSLSLGKINFLVSSLINQGLIKVKRFKNSSNKRAYLYLLTPLGIRKKSLLMQKFLQKKIKEYERLKEEIQNMKRDMDVPV